MEHCVGRRVHPLPPRDTLLGSSLHSASIAVIVLSSRDRFAHRDACRSSWINVGMRIMFMVGMRGCGLPQNQLVGKQARSSRALN